ncbi:hypothetical protein ACFWM5_24020 [Streptomyces bobili]|uniref:hypothetical protein n=1 Tax=Streptomyces bobili TaxID=67280 RepID=UPI0036597CE1
MLAVSGRPGPASLRFETADDGRLLLSQGERTVLLGRSRETTGCCRDLHLHRLTGYRSPLPPLPPLRSAEMRSGVNWAHWYAHRLEENDEVPLHDGRWGFSEKAVFQPDIWSEDFVGEWPGGCLGLYCGGGWLPRSPPGPSWCGARWCRFGLACASGQEPGAGRGATRPFW